MTDVHACVGLSAALMAASAWGASEAELMRKCYRNLTDGARSELAHLAASGSVWHPEDGRTKMFIRGQFFYGNQCANYIHRWYERPLHQDSSMAVSDEPGRMLNEKSWRRTVQTAREMKLDGFAFFPMNPGCMDVFSRSQMPGATVPLLMQFCTWNISGSFDECVRLAGRYLAMTNAYRLGGKPVIVGYPEIRVGDERSIETWKRYRQALIEKFGPNKFVIMPQVWIFNPNDLNKPEMEQAALKRAEARIRAFLRIFDGLYIGQWEASWGPPANLAHATDDIVTPLVRGVLSEPEFRGKKHLGYEFYQAHENPYYAVACLPSGGLKRLLTALNSIEKMQPDFAFGSEWDEENENVHFRPTVSNGQTTQRIMRYYADRQTGTVPTPYPGDMDTSVPNVIVAYRKMIALGEPVEVQFVCVPDGTAEGDYEVSFRWKTSEGATVKAYGPATLSAHECRLLSFVTPSTELAEYRVLEPEVTVRTAQGATRTFSNGFWPMSIDASRVLDNKWVRHALREIAADVTGTLEIGDLAADGTHTVRASVRGPRKFRSVEVLENSDSVYMYDAKTPVEEPGELIAVDFCVPWRFWQTHSPTGWVRIVGAPRVKPTAHNPQRAVSGGPATWLLPKREPKTWNFSAGYGFRIPPEELDDAVLEIGLFPELGVKRLAVKEILCKGTYSFALPGAGQVVARRQLSRPDIPSPPLVDACSFEFRMEPLDPAANLRLQIVDEDYRIWRGPLKTFYRPVGKLETIHVYDEVLSLARPVKVDGNRLYAVGYDFGRHRGDLADAPGRRDSPCVFGGGIARVTRVAAGGCNYQNVMWEAPDFKKLSGGDDTAPKVVREADGFWSLQFTNSNYATLPLQFIPLHSGFEISLRVWPDDVKGRQWLIDSTSCGFQLSLRDGIPEAFLCLYDELFRSGKEEVAGIALTGLKLKARCWNTLKVSHTQKEAWIEVNGVAGKKVEGCGHGYNPLVPALGCRNGGVGSGFSDESFFRGRISDVRMIPQ